MKAKVAVSTVQGKSYFLIVNELREHNIPFISLIPGEPVPSEVKVVVTTEQEKHRVNHEIIILFNEPEVEQLSNKVIRALQGKEAYEKIVVGVDPGEVFGVAVIADGKVIDRINCFSIHEVVLKVRELVKNINLAKTSLTVKTGDGVPVYKELLEALDKELPNEVNLEVAGEAGTNLTYKDKRRSRRLRHISSAMRIAERTGHIYPRGRRTIE